MQRTRRSARWSALRHFTPPPGSHLRRIRNLRRDSAARWDRTAGAYAYGIRRAQKARALKESRTPGRDKQPANAARPTPPAARGAIEVDDINFGQLKCSSGLRGRPHCSRRNGNLLAIGHICAGAASLLVGFFLARF